MHVLSATLGKSNTQYLELKVDAGLYAMSLNTLSDIFYILVIAPTSISLGIIPR